MAPYNQSAGARALVEDGDLCGPSSYAQERAEIFERLAGRIAGAA